MSNTGEFLYYKQNLYSIQKEDTDNYYLHMHKCSYIEKHNAQIHLKPETDDDYYMFLQYDFVYGYQYPKLFNKNQEGYIIFDYEIKIHKTNLMVSTT